LCRKGHQLAQQDHGFRIARVQLNRFAQVIFGAFEFPVALNRRNLFRIRHALFQEFAAWLR